MSKFSDIAQMNVDLHDNHPTVHAALTAVSVVGGLFAFNKIIMSIVKDEHAPESN